MEYAVYPTKKFEKDVRFYRKKRRYLKIDNDIDEIVEELEKGNFLGDIIAELKLPENEDVYKVRVVNSSVNVGKSNGFRLIYYVIKNDLEVYLLAIYSKKDREDIPNSEIAELIKTYCT